ncbi:MAG: hypothetical protein ACRC9P_09315, partial [Bacteroides sp.]
PEFIIASQHGINRKRYQFDDPTNKDETWWQAGVFTSGYGPMSSQFDQSVSDYYTIYSNSNVNGQTLFRGTNESARNWCHNYFEDEYGTDGEYTEYYINARGRKVKRQVQKKFKYQGRWRLPTLAELQYINKIQELDGSAVEGLLMGSNYWTGQTRTVYSLDEAKVDNDYRSSTNVRCVFDSWKLKKER